jgi:hypothetical protein
MVLFTSLLYIHAFHGETIHSSLLRPGSYKSRRKNPQDFLKRTVPVFSRRNTNIGKVRELIIINSTKMDIIYRLLSSDFEILRDTGTGVLFLKLQLFNFLLFLFHLFREKIPHRF